MGPKGLTSIVFDSGIWISALEFGGLPMHALALALMEDNLLICAEIEDEVVRIMAAKFRRSPEILLERMAAFTENARRIVVSGEISGVGRDPKDDFILECAVTGNADVIVTGDKDLLSLRSYGSIRILTARQYLDSVVS